MKDQSKIADRVTFWILGGALLLSIGLLPNVLMSLYMGTLQVHLISYATVAVVFALLVAHEKGIADRVAFWILGGALLLSIGLLPNVLMSLYMGTLQVHLISYATVAVVFVLLVAANEKGHRWYLAALRQYAVFEGRAGRKEYWFFVLFTTILGLVFYFVEPMLYVLYSLAVALPALAVMVRRLHDTNHSGAWVLVSLVPVVGIFVVLSLALQGSQEGDNRYGANPKAARQRSGFVGSAG